jgi:predicted acylesterase/phospholipase RssA
MTEPNSRKRALILSGGGANGAYEIGILKALLTGQCPGTRCDPDDPDEKPEPLDPDIFAGTSVGAFNAAYLLARWRLYRELSIPGTAAIADLEKFWLEQICDQPGGRGNGVYKFLANPLDLIDPRRYLPNPIQPVMQWVRESLALTRDLTYRALNFVSLSDEPLIERLLPLVNIDNFISREPFKRILERAIDYGAIRSTEKILRVAATSWETGQVKTFTQNDFTDERGPLIIMASTAIPGFFTAQKIGAQPFVDGAVLMNTPLHLGQDESRQFADVIHVIYLDPDVGAIPIQDLSNLLSVQYRVQIIGWAERINRGIEIIKTVNDAIYLRKALKNKSPDQAEVVSKVTSILISNPKEAKELTIHRYHPHDPLGGALGMLDFRRDRVQALIDRGFADAISHDCVRSACVVPGKARRIPEECQQIMQFVEMTAGNQGAMK